jgi:hypothetical protein
VAIAHVQSKGVHGTSNGTQTLTFNANTTAGNLVVAVVFTYSAASTSYTVTDSTGFNPFTAVGDFAWDATWGLKSGLYYLPNAPALAGVRVVGSTSAMISLAILEFSGVATSSPLVGTPNKTSGTGTAASSGTTTPTQDGCLILAGGGSGGVIEGINAVNSVGSGFALGYTSPTGNTGPTIIGEYLIQGTAAAISGTFTISQSTKWWAHVAAFKPAAAGAAAASLPPFPRPWRHLTRRRFS